MDQECFHQRNRSWQMVNTGKAIELVLELQEGDVGRRRLMDAVEGNLGVVGGSEEEEPEERIRCRQMIGSGSLYKQQQKGIESRFIFKIYVLLFIFFFLL